MNDSDFSTVKLDLEELKQELKNICQQYAIDRFEPEEIIELLADGEEVGWIVTQLRQDHSDLDHEKLTFVLNSIQSVVAPPKEVMEPVAISAPEQEGEPAIAETEAPAFDWSQIDLSQMGQQLEALTGMKLPAGINMNQIKQIMNSPQGAFISDFGVFCQEQGIDMNAVTDARQLQALNEQWMSTPRAAFDGKTPAEIAQNDSSLFSVKKVETYRRSEPRIGRNDPCPCGSGKKYKKCCGRGI